jgi:hypothetical protein
MCFFNEFLEFLWYVPPWYTHPTTTLITPPDLTQSRIHLYLTSIYDDSEDSDDESFYTLLGIR